MSFRSGFVALVGRPNVGKSTLLNALLGSKLSIVTPRPQTTRDRVVGILNLPGGQIAFVDTPGLHSGEPRALNRAMNRTATAALTDADLVVFDPEYRGVISAKTQRMNVDYSAFEGWKIEGRPSVVTVRGEVAVRDGEFVGDPARGRFLKRTPSRN